MGRVGRLQFHFLSRKLPTPWRQPPSWSNGQLCQWIYQNLLSSAVHSSHELSGCETSSASHFSHIHCRICSTLDLRDWAAVTRLLNLNSFFFNFSFSSWSCCNLQRQTPCLWDSDSFKRSDSLCFLPFSQVVRTQAEVVAICNVDSLSLEILPSSAQIHFALAFFSGVRTQAEVVAIATRLPVSEILPSSAQIHFALAFILRCSHSELKSVAIATRLPVSAILLPSSAHIHVSVLALAFEVHPVSFELIALRLKSAASAMHDRLSLRFFFLQGLRFTFLLPFSQVFALKQKLLQLRTWLAVIWDCFLLEALHIPVSIVVSIVALECEVHFASCSSLPRRLLSDTINKKTDKFFIPTEGHKGYSRCIPTMDPNLQKHLGVKKAKNAQLSWSHFLQNTQRRSPFRLPASRRVIKMLARAFRASELRSDLRIQGIASTVAPSTPDPRRDLTTIPTILLHSSGPARHHSMVSRRALRAAVDLLHGWRRPGPSVAFSRSWIPPKRQSRSNTCSGEEPWGFRDLKALAQRDPSQPALDDPCVGHCRLRQLRAPKVERSVQEVFQCWNLSWLTFHKPRMCWISRETFGRKFRSWLQLFLSGQSPSRHPTHCAIFQRNHCWAIMEDIAYYKTKLLMKSKGRKWKLWETWEGMARTSTLSTTTDMQYCMVWRSAFFCWQ